MGYQHIYVADKDGESCHHSPPYSDIQSAHCFNGIQHEDRLSRKRFAEIEWQFTTRSSVSRELQFLLLGEEAYVSIQVYPTVTSHQKKEKCEKG